MKPALRLAGELPGGDRDPHLQVAASVRPQREAPALLDPISPILQLLDHGPTRESRAGPSRSSPLHPRRKRAALPRAPPAMARTSRRSPPPLPVCVTSARPARRDPSASTRAAPPLRRDVRPGDRIGVTSSSPPSCSTVSYVVWPPRHSPSRCRKAKWTCPMIAPRSIVAAGPCPARDPPGPGLAGPPGTYPPPARPDAPATPRDAPATFELANDAQSFAPLPKSTTASTRSAAPTARTPRPFVSPTGELVALLTHGSSCSNTCLPLGTRDCRSRTGKRASAGCGPVADSSRRGVTPQARRCHSSWASRPSRRRRSRSTFRGSRGRRTGMNSEIRAVAEEVNAAVGLRRPARRRDGQGHRRPALHGRARAHRAARRRPRAAGGGARPREDAGGPDHRRRDRGELQPDPVHPGPAARRRRRHADLRSEEPVLLPQAGAGLRQHRPRRRDQPRARQGPVGAARGDAGAAGHARRQDLRAARPVHRPRDAEPDRAGGDLSAPRGADRPVHAQGEGRLPDARGGAAHHGPDGGRRAAAREEGGLDRGPRRGARGGPPDLRRRQGEGLRREPRLRDARSARSRARRPRAARRVGRVAARHALPLARGARPRLPAAPRLRDARGREGDRARRAAPPDLAHLRGGGRGDHAGEGDLAGARAGSRCREIAPHPCPLPKRPGGEGLPSGSAASRSPRSGRSRTGCRGSTTPSSRGGGWPSARSAPTRPATRSAPSTGTSPPGPATST